MTIPKQLDKNARGEVEQCHPSFPPLQQWVVTPLSSPMNGKGNMTVDELAIKKLGLAMRSLSLLPMIETYLQYEELGISSESGWCFRP